MNNRDTFVEKLNESGEVKYEMSEIHSRILGKLKQVYYIVFKREKKDFLTLKNMVYFKESDTETKSRLHELLDNFTNLVNHYDFLGDDEIKEYLKINGIEFTIVKPQLLDGPIEIEKDSTKDFERSWKFAMANESIPQTRKEILNTILDKAIETQRAIEIKKEEIEKIAQDVDLQCQIKKPFFLKALAIKLLEIKKRSVDNQLKKVEDDIEASKDIISVFDEKREQAIDNEE